jgi:DNA-binding NarL/FixJ family response regulator
MSAMDTAPKALTRVFIVEDSPEIRDRLCAQLAAIDGVDIIGTAESPDAAVQAIISGRPHAVVLDMQLIGGTGLDVMRAVHPLAPEIKFIVFTNHPDPQYRRASMAAGASYFFDKSLDLAKLTEVVSGLGTTLH